MSLYTAAIECRDGNGAGSVVADGADPLSVIVSENDDIVCIITNTRKTNGDLDGSGDITLSDAILALQVISGLDPSGLDLAVEIDGDDRIGTAEALFVLQKLAGER